MQVTNFWFGDHTSEQFRMLIQPTSLYRWSSTNENPKIATDSSGNIFHFAKTDNDYGGTSRYTISLNKFDQKGNLLWSKHNKPASDDTYQYQIDNMQCDSSGNVYCIGYITGPANQGYLVSFDGSGTQRFSRQYGGASFNPFGSSYSNDTLHIGGSTSSSTQGMAYKVNLTTGDFDVSKAINGPGSTDTHDSAVASTTNNVAFRITGGYNPGPNTPGGPSNGIICCNSAITSRVDWVTQYQAGWSYANYRAFQAVHSTADSFYFVERQNTTMYKSFVKVDNTNFSTIQCNVRIDSSNGSSKWSTVMTVFEDEAVAFEPSTERMWIAYRESATVIKLFCFDYSNTTILWQKTFTGTTEGNSDGTTNKNGVTDTDKVELRLNGDYLTMAFRTNDHMQGVDEAHIIVQFPKDMSSINGDWGGYTWADMTELSVGGANGGTYSRTQDLSYSNGSQVGSNNAAINIATENYVNPSYPLTSKYL
jgi:hypothetical protein